MVRLLVRKFFRKCYCTRCKSLVILFAGRQAGASRHGQAPEARGGPADQRTAAPDAHPPHPEEAAAGEPRARQLPPAARLVRARPHHERLDRALGRLADSARTHRRAGAHCRRVPRHGRAARERPAAGRIRRQQFG